MKYRLAASATAVVLALSTYLADGASNAFAADMATRKEPLAVQAPVPIWTGFYAGLNAGGTWGANNSVSLATLPEHLPATTTSIELDSWKNALYDWAIPNAWGVPNNLFLQSGGFIGGGQAGYNWHSELNGIPFVAGVEIDIQGVASGNNTVSATRVTYSSTTVATLSPSTPLTTVTSVSKSLDYLGTVRGRIGYLVTPTLLLYGTGGMAYGGVNLRSSTTTYAPTINPASDFPSLWGNSGSNSDTHVGWTAGGGIEWLFLPNWSLKAEYLYYDLGNVFYKQRPSGAICVANSVPAGLYYAGELWWGNVSQVSAHFNGNLVRAGVNYHFNFGGDAPVLASF